MGASSRPPTPSGSPSTCSRARSRRCRSPSPTSPRTSSRRPPRSTTTRSLSRSSPSPTRSTSRPLSPPPFTLSHSSLATSPSRRALWASPSHHQWRSLPSLRSWRFARYASKRRIAAFEKSAHAPPGHTTAPRECHKMSKCMRRDLATILRFLSFCVHTHCLLALVGGSSNNAASEYSPHAVPLWHALRYAPCGMPYAMPPVACLTLCPLWHALRYAPCGMPYAMPPVACLTLCPLWHALRYAPCKQLRL